MTAKCPNCMTDGCPSFRRLYEGSADPIDAQIEADKTCALLKIAEQLTDVAFTLREMQSR